MFNAYWEALDFDLPAVPETAVSGWQRWIDTTRESPQDILDPAAAPLVPGTQYRVMPRSVAALFLRVDTRSGPAVEAEEGPLRNSASPSRVTRPESGAHAT